MLKTQVWCFLLLVAAPACRGQVSETCKSNYIAPVAKQVTEQLESAKTKSKAADRDHAVSQARALLNQSLTDATLVGACLSGQSDREFAAILETQRTDVQVGATNGVSGSTSLVSSGSIPALLGLALEYGGVEQSFSGSTVTFRTTPAKLVGAMNSAYGTNAKEIGNNAYALMQRFSASLSFNTTGSSTSNTGSGAQLLANYKQLSQVTGRFIAWNDRDPLAVKNWNKILALGQSTAATGVANAAVAVLEPLTESPNYGEAADAMSTVFSRQITDPNQTELQDALESYVSTLQRIANEVQGWNGKVTAYVEARIALNRLNQQLYTAISKAPSLSLEYDFNRPASVQATPSSTGSTSPVASPDLSSLGAVFVANSRVGDYTLNATANFFNESTSSMRGHFRDFQIGAKLDVALGKLPATASKNTLTISGLYEYLYQKPLGIELLINDVTVDQPGSLGFFQAKYTIPVGNSGLQIPISFTASNRTELIKEKDIRGNFGITFDLDKLLGRR